jgi:hypothetical protein
MKKTAGRSKLTYVWIALASIVALVAVVQVVGMMLPVKHRASSSRSLPATPDRVWEVLTDVDRHPQWRSGLESVTKTSDDPLTWTEKSSMGEMPLKTEVFEPGHKWVARIVAEKLPFGGTWTYALQPEGHGTKLIITEDGEVYSPFFRFMSKFVFGHTKTQEVFLSDIEKYLAKEAS